ncbi:hypothetical protein ACWDMY_35360, partial [Streptomyces globisporus]
MPTSPTNRKASVPDFSDVPLTPPASAGSHASAASAASAGEWQAAVTKAADGAEAPGETPPARRARLAAALSTDEDRAVMFSGPPADP